MANVIFIFCRGVEIPNYHFKACRLIPFGTSIKKVNIILFSYKAVQPYQSVKLYSLYSYMKHVKHEALVHTNKHVILVMASLSLTETTFWQSNVTF